MDPFRNDVKIKMAAIVWGLCMERLAYYYEEITRFIRMRNIYGNACVLLTCKIFRLVLLFQMP